MQARIPRGVRRQTSRITRAVERTSCAERNSASRSASSSRRGASTGRAFRLVRLFPLNLRIVFTLDGESVAHAAILPWKRIHSVWVTGATAVFVLKAPPSWWCQHKVPAATVGQAPKFKWTEALVDDPTPGKVASVCTIWTVEAATSTGFAKMEEYIRTLKASARPCLLSSQPVVSNELFPASPAASDASAPPTGVPLGKQAGVPHCRSHSKDVIESLRELDRTLVEARAELPTMVPDVFDDARSERFLQRFRALLAANVESFHLRIATVPAAVVGLPTDDDDD
ncbi:hypothetical protein M885DRAFT_546201 [Pelagophyceae sp. CCMP2097]|nr:hypothetical protein M885DRAFT_546201 [Pelagophyceae sp. CCMP2097]